MKILNVDLINFDAVSQNSTSLAENSTLSTDPPNIESPENAFLSDTKFPIHFKVSASRRRQVTRLRRHDLTFKFTEKNRKWLGKIESRRRKRKRRREERGRGLFRFTKLRATRPSPLPPLSYLSIIVIIGRLANEEARVVVIGGPFSRR